MPQGFQLVNVEYWGPSDRTRVFLSFPAERSFEMVAIASFHPRVNKRDFPVLQRELRREFIRRYNAHNIEIQPSAIGDALICFPSPVERQRFLNIQPIVFGDYHVHFEKDDEAINVTAVDIDREVWLMLVRYPLDCRSFAAIARSLSSFALLKSIHEPEILSRVLVKVVVHDDHIIPPDVVVLAGVGRGTKSRTVPIYLLSRTDILVMPDEQPVPVDGLSHPVPPPAPRWMGPIGNWPNAQAVNNAQGTGSEVGEANMGAVHDDPEAMDSSEGNALNNLEAPVAIGEEGATVVVAVAEVIAEQGVKCA